MRGKTLTRIWTLPRGEKKFSLCLHSVIAWSSQLPIETERNRALLWKTIGRVVCIQKKLKYRWAMLVEVAVSVLLIMSVTPIQIASVKNVTLIPIPDSNNTIITNGTCLDCLCRLLSSPYAALNCLSNNTCRFFTTFPLRYQLQQTPGTSLHFPNQSIPEPSQCCMPDLNLLLNKLRNSTATYVNVSSPRSLLLDSQGYLTTVSFQAAYLYRYDVLNLSRINFTYTFPAGPVSNAIEDGVYFVGLDNNYIAIVDCISGAYLNSITSPFLNGPRGIIFLGGGQTMVVSSVFSGYLLFFNRTNTVPINYTLAYRQLVSYPNPHGLWRVSDTLFFATSWSQKRLYSHSRVNSSYWDETLIVDSGATLTSSGGNHIVVDECDRRWFSLGSAGVLIYNKNGVFLGTFTLPLTGDCFDVLFLDNYVMYVSDYGSGKITRIDPTVVCWLFCENHGLWTPQHFRWYNFVGWREDFYVISFRHTLKYPVTLAA